MTCLLTFPLHAPPILLRRNNLFIQILGYHILDRKYNASDIESAIKANGGSYSISTLEKDKLTFTMSSNNKLIVSPINGGIPAYVMKVRQAYFSCIAFELNAMPTVTSPP